VNGYTTGVGRINVVVTREVLRVIDMAAWPLTNEWELREPRLVMRFKKLGSINYTLLEHPFEVFGLSACKNISAGPNLLTVGKA
jgi:hypothetical protein